jgi:nucleoid DNA-binding protein
MEKELVKKVARLLRENPKMVASAVDTYEKFIADTIRKGELQNVRVPLFGIFKVNMKKMKYLTQIKPTL